MDSAFAAAERAARECYGKLVAWLAYQWRDVAAAEVALSEALLKALACWPRDGVPDAPQAWLLTVARRELLQVARRQRLHASPEVQALFDEQAFDVTPAAVPDARLMLMFVCAHPAIDAKLRPALMLQTVLGLDARIVAQAMLASPSAVAQRLVRAKQKIRDARLRFEAPVADELPARLYAVLEAVYAAYGLGWDAVDGGGGGADRAGLRAEALFLGELVQGLLPDEPEAMGLLALMQFCEARTRARWADDGRFVPLHEQHTALWHRPTIQRAETLLRRAAACSAPGPFQIEAAIQSAHCQRLFGGHTPWPAVVQLYTQLLAMSPSLGVQVAHALACAHGGDLARASRLLGAMADPRRLSYQPYWVAKAHVESLRLDNAAAQSLEHAIGLTASPAVRAHLLTQLALLGGAGT